MHFVMFQNVDDDDEVKECYDGSFDGQHGGGNECAVEAPEYACYRVHKKAGKAEIVAGGVL